jgi:hypothetical protein
MMHGTTYILNGTRVLLDLAVRVAQVHVNAVVLDRLLDLAENLQRTRVILLVFDQGNCNALGCVGVLGIKLQDFVEELDGSLIGLAPFVLVLL